MEVVCFDPKRTAFKFCLHLNGTDANLVRSRTICIHSSKRLCRVEWGNECIGYYQHSLEKPLNNTAYFHAQMHYQLARVTYHKYSVR